MKSLLFWSLLYPRVQQGKKQVLGGVGPLMAVLNRTYGSIYGGQSVEPHYVRHFGNGGRYYENIGRYQWMTGKENAMSRRRIAGILAGILLMVTISGCASGRGYSPSPMTPLATESRPALPAVTPSPTPEERKPFLAGSGTPWTPPPSPTLPSQQSAWRIYEFPEVGVRLQLPSEWNVLRNPGFYLVTADGDYRLTVGACCAELPRTLPEFQQAIVPYWYNLHARDFLVMPLQGQGWQGVGVWHLPNVCLDVYIPSSEIVRQITFWPIFCKPGRERLVPLGQQILDSLEIFPPTGGWESP